MMNDQAKFYEGPIVTVPAWRTPLAPWWLQDGLTPPVRESNGGRPPIVVVQTTHPHGRWISDDPEHVRQQMVKARVSDPGALPLDQIICRSLAEAPAVLQSVGLYPGGSLPYKLTQKRLLAVLYSDAWRAAREDRARSRSMADWGMALGLKDSKRTLVRYSRIIRRGSPLLVDAV